MVSIDICLEAEGKKIRDKSVNILTNLLNFVCHKDGAWISRESKKVESFSQPFLIFHFFLSLHRWKRTRMFQREGRRHQKLCQRYNLALRAKRRTSQHHQVARVCVWRQGMHGLEQTPGAHYRWTETVPSDNTRHFGRRFFQFCPRWNCLQKCGQQSKKFHIYRFGCNGDDIDSTLSCQIFKTHQLNFFRLWVRLLFTERWFSIFYTLFTDIKRKLPP
jgi:hypothetical protein